MSRKGRSKSNQMQLRNVCAYIDPRTRTDHLTLAVLRCIDAGHSSPPTFISVCRSETTERIWKQIRGWYLPQSPCDLIPHSNLWHLWEAAKLNRCPVYTKSVCCPLLPYAWTSGLPNCSVRLWKCARRQCLAVLCLQESCSGLSGS